MNGRMIAQRNLMLFPTYLILAIHAIVSYAFSCSLFVDVEDNKDSGIYTFEGEFQNDNRTLYI